MEINLQTVIITGAASGMGAATAKYLAAKGAKVILIDQDESVVVKAQEIGGLGFVCDVSSEDSVKKVLSNITAPSICINCAGIACASRIVSKHGSHDLSEFETVIKVNLLGTFNVMRLCAEQMINEDKVGVIINTASVAAFEGQIGQAAYSASKGGIVSMTLPAAREFAQFGIRVMTIAPGLVETSMMQNMPQQLKDDLKQQVPFPKRFAKPEEFAMRVAHIIENDMLNGEVIRLDGGLRLP